MTIWEIYIGWALFLATGLFLRLVIGPRCPHGWELVDKTEFASLMEESKRLGMVLSNVIGNETIQEFYRRKVKIVIRCPKCGATKIFDLQS